MLCVILVFELMDSSEELHSCTYFVSGPHLVHQGIYKCITCESLETSTNSCCCAGCAEFCHKDHDVEFLANGLAYCDCGSGFCVLYQNTQSKYRSMLEFEQQYLYAERPLSVCDRAFEVFSLFHSDIPAFCQGMTDHCSSVISHSKDTFWVGSDWNYKNSDTTPGARCELEELALFIYRSHVKRIEERLPVPLFINPKLSGAEWWIQIKNLDEPDSAIDLHYDKDEEIAETFGVGVFPYLSTVTYLSDISQFSSLPQPTLILSTTCNEPVGTDINEVFVSYPRQGKHIAFDGRLLHGAPSDPLLKTWGTSRGESCCIGETLPAQRVTFLVNIWLNHHPASVSPLPDQIAQALSQRSTCSHSPSHDLSSSLDLYPMQNNLYFISVDSSVEIDKSEDESGVQLSSIELRSAEGNELSPEIRADGSCSQLSLPFVSSDSIWGREEGDCDLIVSFNLPDIPPVPGLQTGSSFRINYRDESLSARLMYLGEDDGGSSEEWDDV
jgi:hypothetical protein